jgi:fluoroacetyl-CoA thioesterase
MRYRKLCHPFALHNTPHFEEPAKACTVFTVQPADFAVLGGNLIHRVCATFTLAREAEYAGRLVLEAMLQPGQEGIGTMVEVIHVSPAFEGEEVSVFAEMQSFNGTELICTFQALVSGRVIARGKTGQRIISKERLLEITTPPAKQG